MNERVVGEGQAPLEDKAKKPEKPIKLIKAGETYWVPLGLLKQEHLEDLSVVYCGVFGADPEDIRSIPDVEEVREGVMQSGYYVQAILGREFPSMDVRRKLMIGGRRSLTLVRFGLTENHQSQAGKGRMFQRIADQYLYGSAEVAVPLSKLSLRR
jgi:hypothetical protein